MKKRFYDNAGFYQGISDARAQEARDGAMIPSSSNSPANMPQNVIMKTFAKTPSVMPENYGDSMKSIDKQINMDESKFKTIMKK